MHRPLIVLSITAAIVALTACSSGPSSRTTDSSIDPHAVTIAARDLKFSMSTISAPANEPFQLAFDNQESAPHNVAIYRDNSATERVFESDPFGGPAVVAYDVPPLAAGTYVFRCDVHPDMSGQLTVG